MSRPASFDWTALKNEYLQTKNLKALSREVSGDSSRPSYSRLRQARKEQGWDDNVRRNMSGLAPVEGLTTVLERIPAICDNHPFPPDRKPSRRYLASLPQRYQQPFQDALADEDLMSLRPNIAIADSLLHEALTGLQTGETNSHWFDLRASLREMTRAQQLKDDMAATIAINEIFKLISEGASEAERRREVVYLQEHRKKLIESEERRRVSSGEYLHYKEVEGRQRSLIEAIKINVPDSAVIRSISTTFQELEGKRQQTNGRTS